MSVDWTSEELLLKYFFIIYLENSWSSVLTKKIMDYRTSLAQFIKTHKQPGEGSGISHSQKHVLHKRKSHIASEVEEAAVTLIDGFREHELIDDEMHQSLKEEKSPSGQVLLLLEIVLVSRREDAFAIFMTLAGKSHPELANEIITEVRYEDGVACVEEEVAREAGTLVHRKFGTSKRFGEGDKKDVVDLLGVRMQLLNEEWQVKTQKTEDHATELQNVIDRREKLAKGVNKTLHDFIDKHKKQLTNNAHGMVTTSQHLEKIIADSKKDTLENMEESLDMFLERLGQVLYHRDMLMEERGKCLEMLGVRDERKSLDRALQQKLLTTTPSMNELTPGQRTGSAKPRPGPTLGIPSLHEERVHSARPVLKQ